ncbi:structural protein P5 [Parabacteroides sp. Marseille-P3160]|uniref:structural protein P5 n=1 Tax=Parabacteroides sp. Marseille-P3160 TaxID=1917887 RepID=UPI0009B94192|nr:structural protein P5 [Parabacteroides sp. Marseille-P3160]
MATTKYPRGLRNNNPGNIRINSDKFQGEVIPSKDKSFKTFVSMAYGYRSMFRIIRNYKLIYKLNTLREWIYRWAPPEDSNDTEAYIKSVSNNAKVRPDVEIDVNNEDLMCRIIAAMSGVENGIPAVMGDVRAGWKLLTI